MPYARLLDLCYKLRVLCYVLAIWPTNSLINDIGKEHNPKANKDPQLQSDAEDTNSNPDTLVDASTLGNNHKEHFLSDTGVEFQSRMAASLFGMLVRTIKIITTRIKTNSGFSGKSWVNFLCASENPQ